jgi:REP element-mobilizing transposase RayT
MPPRRLARLERVHIRAPIYFVTACTSDRRSLLACSEIHSAFVIFAQRGPTFGAWIGAYVLMPDHLHLFVALDDERLSLSQWTRALKGVLSKELRQLGIPTPHSQKGFFDHVLRVMSLLHRNGITSETIRPCRAGSALAGMALRRRDFPSRVSLRGPVVVPL